jgi:ABC-type branched-subunit amino acid transport system substrate-binding protein
MRRAVFAVVAAGLAVPLIGVCAVAPTAAAADHHDNGSALTIGMIEPFSGGQALFGPPNLAGCIAGAKAVNAAGGVLGHKFVCKSVNTTGDPADAVPAVDQMLTDVSNLVFTIGPGTTAPATAPILEAAHIPEFSLAGSAQFDHNHSRYFYRLLPADIYTGAAMAYFAYKRGFRTAAMVFTPTGSSTVGTGLAPEFKKLGGKILANVTVTANQPSYRTQVTQVLGGHPQVIFSETGPQTAATFWSEMAQQTSSIPPVVGDTTDTYSTFTKAVLPGVAGSKFTLYAVGQTNPSPSPGLSEWVKELKTLSSQFKDPMQWVTNAFPIADYDSVVIAALAMEEAHSTKPTVFSRFVTDVTRKPGPGVEVVHTFAQGVQAIHAGHKIAYSGATGLIVFNKYNNFASPFVGLKLNSQSHQFKVTGKTFSIT